MRGFTRDMTAKAFSELFATYRSRRKSAPEPVRIALSQAFDGISLPYGNGVFDLILTRQVFEHVRHPDRLLG